MRISRALSIALLALSITPTAQAADYRPTYFYSGNDLLRVCEEANGALVCLGYVMGISDILMGIAHNTGHPRSAAKYCSEKGTTGRQMKDATVLFLKNNPAQRTRPAAELVLAAFKQAWPCR